MLTKPITIVETQGFVRQAERIWDETERLALVDYMAVNPEAGIIIPGTGGIRKLRWGRAGIGKRGGARVVYFYYDEDVPLFLLKAYAKNQAADITSDDKRAFTAVTEAIKAQHATTRTAR